MSALAGVWGIAGVLSLVLLAYDVFRTVFRAQGRGGPINHRQNRLIWTAVSWLGTRGGGRHAGILSLGGPLMALGTIVVWSAVLLTGFALVYLPHVASFHYSPSTAGPPLLEAFYYSGIISSTLGQGDVVARGGWLRALTVLQALAGFGSVTVAVTYVLAVYRELVASETLAMVIDARLSAGPAATDSREFPAGGDAAAWDRGIALRLANSIESHHNYPILHYFRPSRAERSLPYQVARLFDAAVADRRPDGGQQRGDAPNDSISARALAAIIQRYIGEVHDLFVSTGARDPQDRATDSARLREILAMLRYDWPRRGEANG